MFTTDEAGGAYLGCLDGRSPPVSRPRRRCDRRSPMCYPDLEPRGLSTHLERAGARHGRGAGAGAPPLPVRSAHPRSRPPSTTDAAARHGRSASRRGPDLGRRGHGRGRHGARRAGARAGRRLSAHADVADSRAAGRDDWRARPGAGRGDPRRHGDAIVDALVRTLREQHANFNVLSSVLDLLAISDIDVVEPLIRCLTTTTRIFGFRRR